MKTNPNDSAMPVSGTYEIHHGLTKREKLIFDLYVKNAPIFDGKGMLSSFANHCIQAADILLEALNKPTEAK